jgi:hypothetical protein
MMQTGEEGKTPGKTLNTRKIPSKTVEPTNLKLKVNQCCKH